MKKKGKHVQSKPPAPFTEALAIIRGHAGLTIDRFFEILSIRGFDVTNLDVIDEGADFDTPIVYNAQCDSCQHPITLTMIINCSLCPARVCDTCFYVCHKCNQPVCADHVHQYSSPSLFLCSACDSARSTQ